MYGKLKTRLNGRRAFGNIVNGYVYGHLYYLQTFVSSLLIYLMFIYSQEEILLREMAQEVSTFHFFLLLIHVPKATFVLVTF